MKHTFKSSNTEAEFKITFEGNKKILHKRIHKNINRALASFEKHSLFRNYSYKNISAVPVIDVNFNDSFFEIKMPYVEGYVGENIYIYGDKEIGNQIFNSLNSFLENNILESVVTGISSEVFERKFIQTIEYTENAILRKHILKYQNIVKSIPNKVYLPMGKCHGDLTFSNIIFSDGKIFMIDFLDSYLESPLQDVAKIIQEFDLLWSVRYLDEANLVRAKIFNNIFYPDYISFLLKKYKYEIYLMLFFTIIRIAPYSRDQITNKWIMNSLEIFDKTYRL